MAEENQNEGNEGQSAEPIFTIDRLYTKDLSLEIPHAPEIFLEMGEPEVSIEFSVGSADLNDGYYQTVLTLTCQGKKSDGTSIFLIEVQQAGIANIQNQPAEAVEYLLRATLPTVLYPFAYETVTNMLLRAGLPPIQLPTAINFESLYAAYRRQQAEQEGHAKGSEAEEEAKKSEAEEEAKKNAN